MILLIGSPYPFLKRTIRRDFGALLQDLVQAIHPLRLETSLLNPAFYNHLHPVHSLQNFSVLRLLNVLNDFSAGVSIDLVEMVLYAPNDLLRSLLDLLVEVILDFNHGPHESHHLLNRIIPLHVESFSQIVDLYDFEGDVVVLFSLHLVVERV